MKKEFPLLLCLASTVLFAAEKPLTGSAATSCTPGAMVTTTPFGVTAKGEKCSRYTIRGAGGLKLEVTDFGGRVLRCWAPDKDGKLADVTLGWNTVGEYEKNGFSMGTLIGRFGNRIADGKFTLDGKEYQLPVNEVTPAPRHCNLHSGPKGWDAKVWKAEPILETPARNDIKASYAGLKLSLVSPDGDMGFPGTVKCTVTYKVLPNNTWTIDYEATTDKPTVLNLTHHTYWNMAGEESGNVLGQELQIFADKWTRTDDGLIPVKDEPVAGTGFDFTTMRKIGAKADWMAAQPFLKCTDNWYDHNFVLRGKLGELHPAATMRDPKSGRRLEIWTTEPCMQMYGAQNMTPDKNLAAKAKGKAYGQFQGVALETQHYPDSPNHPEFPSTVLRPGETFRSHTEYRFTAE